MSAYITFQKKEDASRAIQTLNGATVEGRTIRYIFLPKVFNFHKVRRLEQQNIVRTL